MKGLSIFQIVVIGAFVFFTVVGVLIFAGVGGLGGDSRSVGEVEIWGTYDEQVLTSLLRSRSFDDPRFEEVTYVEKDPRFFTEELIEALASGSGPDLFFLEQDSILRFIDKVQPIPYETFSQREFRDTFIEEGELFLTEAGIVALPFMVDPMVLYWNRDHYTRGGVVRPPQFWDELQTLALNSSLTRRGESGAILQSAFAIGEYSNINHAKELLSLLMLQAGTSITAYTESGELIPTLLVRLQNGQIPSENALRFYTDFANPTKSVYTWNRALDEAQEEFVAGTLSNYIGFASELPDIRRQNSNLNFDVAMVPQVRTGTRSVTFGTVTGLAIPRASDNINGAAQIAFALTSDDLLSEVSDVTGLPPVSRSLLSDTPSDPFKVIFRDAALRADAWLEPNNTETERIFKQMIESVVSGRARVSQAVEVAQQELRSLLE